MISLLRAEAFLSDANQRHLDLIPITVVSVFLGRFFLDDNLRPLRRFDYFFVFSFLPESFCIFRRSIKHRSFFKGLS